jgi:hypothetical protein
MNKILPISIVLMVVNPLLSFSQSKGIDKNLENISGRYAECAAYYRLAYYALMSSNQPETAKAYRESEDMAMLYALMLAREGRGKDLAVEVTNSRIEMYMKKMKQDINNRNENISILINKYHFGCQEAMQNPSDEIVPIMEKYLKK